MSRKDSPLIEPTFGEEAWLVACLCAEWCDTCRAFRVTFDALSTRHAGVRFRWIDIEDEADLVDGIDVDNFPTILIQHGRNVLFLGATLPNASIVERQLVVLQAGPTAVPIQAPDLLSRLEF